MKPTLLKLTGVFLILAGVFASCKEPEEPVYPVNVSFTEYSLGSSCQWKNLSYDDKVIIINSNEELKKYIECKGESNYPAIDFSKSTLILAHGTANSSHIVLSKSLQQISEQNYEMKVNILLTQLPYLTFWEMPIIVNKLNKTSIIYLVVTYKAYE